MSDTMDEQLRLLRETEKKLGSEHDDLVPLLDALALEYHMEGFFDLAEDCYKRAILIQEKSQGGQSPSLVPRLHNLGLLFRIQEKFAQAEEVYKRAHSLLTSAEPDLVAVATEKNYLAGLYFAWGRYNLAEDLILESRAIYESRLGKEHPFHLFAIFALALVLQKQGKSSEAEGYFQQLEKLSKPLPRKEFLESYDDLPEALYGLARANFRQKRFDNAEILLRYALLHDVWKLWPAHPKVAESLQMLGDLYAAQGMHGEAENIYRKALAIRETFPFPRNQEAAVTAYSLARLLDMQRRFDEAERLYLKAIEIRTRSAYPPLLAATFQSFALMLKEMRRLDEAARYEEEAQRILKAYGPGAT